MRHSPSLRLTPFAVTALTMLAAAPAAGAGPEAETTVNAFSGSLTSSIPIGVPGFRGLEPKLALRYDSGGGNGFVGVGWSLSGVSVIERASPGGGAPRYDATDIYRLDGNVLIPCAQAAASPSCTAGGTHATRVESYAKIKYDGTANTWTVWQRDGTKATYAARCITGRNDYRWTLASVADAKNNAVSYGWTCLGGNECYLDTVTYNGTVVKLWREARTDAVTYATGAGLATMGYRLKTIDVTVSGARARTYKLAYAASASTSRSLLASVQQYGRDTTLDAAGAVTGGTSLPSMLLSYSPEPGGGFGYWDLLAPWHCVGVLATGDFNGDGRTDVLCQSGSDISVSLAGPGGLFGWWSWSAVGMCSGALVTGDFDGDGKTDILCQSNTDVHVGLATGSGGFGWWSWSAVGMCPGALATGDFDGDGKTDILCQSKGSVYVGLATGSGGFGWWSWSAVGMCPGTVATGDFNGDGKTDLLCQGMDTSSDVYIGLATGSGGFGWWSWSAVGMCPGTLSTGDFNGDGKIDILCLSSGNVYVGLATGSGGVGWWSWSAVGMCPGTLATDDFNGDGKTDLLCLSGSSMYVGLATGSGGFGWWSWSAPTGMCPGTVATGDFNGDGKTDLLCQTSSSGSVFFGWAAGGPHPSNALTSISNGLGGTTTIAYLPSSGWPNTYLPVGTVFPTVVSVTTSDGRGDAQATTYTYHGARWRDATTADPVREFLGFRKATTTLSATAAYSETYYWQRAGTIAKPEVIYKRQASGTIMSFDKFVFTENTAPPYTSLVTAAWSYECNGDGVVDANHNYVSGCRRVAATYAWDQYANLTTEYQYGDWDLSGDERTAVRSFAPNTTAYIVGLPAYEELRAGVGLGGTLLSRTRFYYDGAMSEATAPTEGKLTKKGIWLDQTGGYLEHAFAYDGYGNQTAVTDPSGQVVTKSYDATYHLVTLATTNPLGHVMQTSWDPVLGVALTQTDPDGNVTTHAYDVFGRGTLTNSPDGAQVKVEHLDYGTVTSQRVRTSKLMPGATWVWDDDYFDGVGRAYKKVSSTGVTQDTIYGATGKVWKKSLPYVAGETVRHDVSTYDDMGRPLTSTAPDGSVVSQAYDDGMVAVTDPSGTVRTSWFDAFQRLTKVREVIGGVNQDTTFAYDRLGRRTKSVDAAGNQTVVSYDSVGRALQKSDPDQGLWTYGYDAVGRITRETDALAKATTVGYDVLGRATRRTYHDETYDSYTFDEAGRGTAKGRQTTAVSASGVTTRAFYDVMGRRTRYEEVLDGTPYVLSHGYDVAGRLTKTTYPDGEIVSYGYGTSGLATGKIVSVGGSAAGPILFNVGYTSKGQVASLRHGNGVVTSMTFDAYGERVTRIAVGVFGKPCVTFTYGYDGLGRVTSLTAPAFGLSNWGYGYDSIGRLTSAINTLDATRNETFGYDALGRRTSSSTVGAYTYGNAAHVHAVTAAGGITYAYDANGNLTSGAGRSLTYNLDHRPETITYGGSTTSFVYDAHGVRVKKSGPAGTVRYVGGVYENRGGAVTKYYFAGGLRLAKRDANGNQYLHADHLGSTRLITNQAGLEAQRYEYAPFGTVIGQSGTRPDSHRYTGQEADDETGLLFYQARYYDPALGRFLQPDSLLPSANSPQELDLYAYANNSPINYVDPSGHAVVAVVLVAAAAVTAAVVLGYSLVAVLVIGTALTFTNNPILQTIGMVMAGYAGATIFGGPGLPGLGLSAGQVGALVALAQSPISPLDPTIKKAIGWAYTVWGAVTTIQSVAKGDKAWTPLELFKDKSWAKVTVTGSEVWNYVKATVLVGLGEVAMTAAGWVVGYASSSWGTAGRYAVAFFARTLIIGTQGVAGPLGALGATYDLAYTLKYPDGRVIDLSGGAGGEAFSFYYHTGFEATFAFGRQHIRVGDRGGYWELGDTRAGFFGPGLGWGGWVTTQKITVIMNPAQASTFRGALEQAALAGGRYQGYHADSYTYISAALQFATGKTAADLHINPGLLHW